jgi:hypothetical protein
LLGLRSAASANFRDAVVVAILGSQFVVIDVDYSGLAVWGVWGRLERGRGGEGPGTCFDKLGMLG